MRWRSWRGSSSPTPGRRRDERSTTVNERTLVELPIDAVLPDPGQPRRHFPSEALGELAASIVRHGIVQPLLVKPLPQEESGAHQLYQIVAGERRWRAAAQAGLAYVPALVLQVDSATGRELTLVENLHRSDLRPLELAQAYEAILRENQVTQEELALRLGKSRVSITNTLRLLGLGYAAQHALAEGRMSEGHARALLGVSGTAQEQALLRVLSAELNVRQTEGLVRRLAKQRPRAARASKQEDLGYLASALRIALGATVELTGSEESGRILIEYHSREELERLCERIGGDEVLDERG